MLNASDERFSTNSSGRKAWMTATTTEAATLCEVEEKMLAEMEVNQVLELGIENPAITFNGITYSIKVEIFETTEPNDYQAKNIEKTAKRAGKDGDFLTFEGNYIFSNTIARAVAEGGEVSHTFLPHDKVNANSTEGVKANANSVSVPVL